MANSVKVSTHFSVRTYHDGHHAKVRPDGTLQVFNGDDRPIALYAAGEWRWAADGEARTSDAPQ